MLYPFKPRSESILFKED